MFCQITLNNTHVPTTSCNITRTCIVLIQLRIKVTAVYSTSPTSFHQEQLHLHLLFSIPCLKHVSKCPAGISCLWKLVHYITQQTSAALLNLQCQVLQNFHLTEIALLDSLWHQHCILFPTFDDLTSTQTQICTYRGKEHS